MSAVSLLQLLNESCGASGSQRLLPIVGVGLPATQLISNQRSFMTGS